jgi:hypothetical protein
MRLVLDRVHQQALPHQQPLPVIPISEVIPSRGGCLTSRSSPEGGCGRQLASSDIDRGPQRVDADFFCSYPTVLLFLRL